MQKEIVLEYVKSVVTNAGVKLDLSHLDIYYDGLAEEEFTRSGTAVFRCPVWYGGIDAEPESFTISVYEIDDKVLCVSLSRFLKRRRHIDKDIMIKTA